MESIKTKHIIEQLKIKLKEVLPGDTPRNLFAPVINGKKQERSNPTKTTRKASVLLLLWERNEKLQVVFTLRSSDLLSHSGQISFPGGEAMPNETSIETALRETFEEIGVPNFRLEILGQLSPIYIMPSDFYIQPIVAYSKDYLDFKINKDEVEEVITKPLDFFTFKNIAMKEWEFDGRLVDVPYWSIHPSVPLWGATAMMLSELIDIYLNIDKIDVE